MAFDELLHEIDSWVAASMARHAALHGSHLAKMLLKSGFGWQIYVSAKRTQIIRRGKHGLSSCGGEGSDENGRSENLGSFSQNEPNLEVI